MDVPWTSFIVRIILYLFVLESTSTFKPSGTCFFPERWEGTWFQSGVRQPILVEGPRLSTKGRCLSSDGDKFLMVDEKRACYRCVVIHEKHINVLQYKETYCQSREALPTLCGLITGDALLYSMFRENAVPIQCPFRGPFTFTYNSGHGECRSPVSSMETCTEESRLLLSYQACPDVYASESAIEELQCLASWKEGSARYLVGKLHHTHVTSNEDRYRCFIYEKSSSSIDEMDEEVDFKVAQSGDATCNGLFSATEGSKTMILRKAPQTSKCRFPFWISNYNHWHTLDYSGTYSFHHRNSTLRITNSSGMDMKVVCMQQKQSTRDENVVILVTHFTMGCENGYICMAMYRRDSNVLEMQMGSQTKRKEDACDGNHFNKNTSPYLTLVTTAPETRPCPYTGRFEVSNLLRANQVHPPPPSTPDGHSRRLRNTARMRDLGNWGGRPRRVERAGDEFDCDSEGFADLLIGCAGADAMEFKTECAVPDLITSYSCHGRWEENGTNFLITTPISRTSHGARRYCFIYKESLAEVMFSTSSDSCNRLVKPGVTGELVFNISSTGKCVETNSSSTIYAVTCWFYWSVVGCLVLRTLIRS